MRDSIYRITLDVYNTETQVQLTARKDDSARRIFATFTEHGKPFAVPYGTRAVMVVNKPDGTQVQNDCDIRGDGTVIFDFTEFVTNVLGKLDCVLTLLDEDDSVIVSPKFIILVLDSTYNAGQIWGEELRQDVTALKEKSVQSPLTYKTAPEMLSDDKLKKGQMVATRGRWYENDGGARTYIITDAAGAKLNNGSTINPLALPLSGGTLYAVPVIEDTVTVLDIGLERGRLRRSELPTGEEPDAYANQHERDNGGIAATNSAKLQRYLDAIPTNGDADANFVWGGAHMNRIFFPNGHWYFRDPIVVRKPVSFIGTRLGATIETRSYPTYECSHVVFLAAEYVCTSGSQSTSTGAYIGDNCIVSEQKNASKLGDENYDATVTPVVYESAYFDHALFYAAYDNVVFKDLDFSAESQAKPLFYQYTHPRNAEGAGLGDHDTGWKPKGGAPWNPFTVRRRMKGVCAIIVRKPILDTSTGKIIVKPTQSSGTIISAAVKYESDVGANTPKYCKIDGCNFYGFSGSAVVAGRLAYLTDSMFFKNYISYTASTDNFLHNSWFGNGFVGLVTNGHSVLQSDGMYIDMMAGFGVMAKMTRSTFKKKTVKYVKNKDDATGMWPVGTRGDGGEADITTNGIGDPFFFCEHSLPTAAGRLTGHYNCVVDCCVMGAYFAYDSFLGAAISGLVKRCGFLYNHDIRIVDKNDFVRDSNFAKAKNYYENLDAVQATYGGGSPYRWSGSAWVESSDTSKQSVTDYLDNDFGASGNVVKAYKYIKSYKSGSEVPADYVWDTTNSVWTEPASQGETRQKLSTFLALPKTYSHNLRYVEWLKAGADGIQLEASRDSYYESTTDGGEYIDTDVLEELIEAQIQTVVDQYNSDHGTTYTIDELIEMGEIADSIYDEKRAYVLENWDELAPEDARTSVKALIAKDRTDNFRKLIGTAAVSVCLAKSLTFSGQMMSKAFARSHTAEAGTWEATPNAMPIFGFNLRSARTCDFRGFNRVPYANQDGQYHGGIMTPVIMQYSTKTVLIESHTSLGEDAVFNVKTNNNAASADDKRALRVSLSHDPFGRPTCNVTGTVYLTEDSITQTSRATPNEGATALDNNKLFGYTAYPCYYQGDRPNVIGVPLFGLGDTNKGKPVGLLTINFQTKRINLYGFADFDGTVMPVST